MTLYTFPIKLLNSGNLLRVNRFSVLFALRIRHFRISFLDRVTFALSPLLTWHETGGEYASPRKATTLPYRDGCKNRFYRQVRLSSFLTSGKIFCQRLRCRP